MHELNPAINPRAVGAAYSSAPRFRVGNGAEKHRRGPVGTTLNNPRATLTTLTPLFAN